MNKTTYRIVTLKIGTNISYLLEVRDTTLYVHAGKQRNGIWFTCSVIHPKCNIEEICPRTEWGYKVIDEEEFYTLRFLAAL